MVNQGQRVQVTVLPPIDPAAFGAARRQELIAEVRKAIASALGQAEG